MENFRFLVLRLKNPAKEWYCDATLSPCEIMKIQEAPHPGFILKTFFLEPLKLSVYRLSKDIGVAQTRMSQIISGKRAITPDTALRLSRYFALDDLFWMQAQAAYDLAIQKEKIKSQLESIKPYKPGPSR